MALANDLTRRANVQTNNSAERIKHEVSGLAHIEWHGEIDSTNARARVLADEGAPSDSVVMAHAQSAGRGRFDRRFISPAGCGVYMSYLVRPQGGVDPAALTSCAAVAIAEAVEELSEAEVKIKWVNDLYINSKKMCGILTEGRFLPNGDLDYAVIGFGVNVRHADFPPELQGIATSIEDETGLTLEIADVAVACLNHLRARLSHIDDNSHYDAYRARSFLDGRRVTVQRGGETYDAYVRGIGMRGELLLTLARGEEITILSGEVVGVHASAEDI